MAKPWRAASAFLSMWKATSQASRWRLPGVGCAQRVWVIGRWHLRDRWWQPWETQSDRRYYRLVTADHEVFEVYRELTSKGLWVLNVVHD